MISYVIDRLVGENEAVLNVSDISIQRGYGIFDFFRTARNIPLFIDDYLDRFYRSAAELRLQPLQTRDEIRLIVDQMIAANKMETSGFKIILTGGYSLDGFEPAAPNLIILQQPVALPETDAFEKGMKIILHDYQRELPYAKSINYLVSIHLRDKIVEAGADEALYHSEGKVLEFPRSNIFIVTKDEKIVTPAENVLKGITRKKVLELAKDKYGAKEADVSLDEMKNVREVFLTSSTKRIMPIVAINNQPVGDGKPGEVTRSLLQSFMAMEENYLNSHKV